MDPLCKKALSGLFSPRKVAAALQVWLKEQRMRKIKYFYLASPPKMADFVGVIKKAFASPGWFSARTGTVFYSPDLEEMVYRRFSRCDREKYHGCRFLEKFKVDQVSRQFLTLENKLTISRILFLGPDLRLHFPSGAGNLHPCRNFHLQPDQFVVGQRQFRAQGQVYAY